MKFYKFTCLMAGMLLNLSACATPLNASDNVPAEYSAWLNDLRQEMVGRGISKKTVKKVFAKNYYHPSHEAVKIDRRQAEFILTSTDYINRIVSQKRVEKGRENYKKLYPLLKNIERKYGVPAPYIVAFWGAETDYGSHFGSFSTIEVLINLSYDKRRSAFFKEQLYQTLKIVDTWGVNPDKIVGSWAGAMGHFQFMPSTFNTYAVDFNQDGQIDIWHSFEDAAASAANYLSRMGWDTESPWGQEVSLPWNFDFANTGRGIEKSVAEWKKLGVKNIDKKPLALNGNLKASVIVPEGKKGNAYLVLPNFKIIMRWNRSENYALAIGTLADYFANARQWQPVKQDSSVRIKADDIIKIQSFINRMGWFKLDEDGQLGTQTREAVKSVQGKAKLPQDGYPDKKLLEKINNYNPGIGFEIPVPPRKLHKRI